VFLDGRPFQTPKLIRNEFGGSVGGPIVIPSLGVNGKKTLYNGRNRSFFFFTREGSEWVQGITRDFRVPTAAMRQGDFSSLSDAQGRLLQLYDPMTTRQEEFANGRIVSVRDPFSNNQIPIQRLNPLTKRLLDLTPMPTDVTNPNVTTNLRMVVPTNQFPMLSDNPTVLRLDHKITEKDSFFIKVNGGTRQSHYLATADNSGPPTTNKEANITYQPVRGRSVALSLVHTFSSTFFVETLTNRTWQLSTTVNGNRAEELVKRIGLAKSTG